MRLTFRAKLKDGTWFEQQDQFLTSFLRRVLTLYGVGHEQYLPGGSIESVLEMKIDDGEWQPVEDQT